MIHHLNGLSLDGLLWAVKSSVWNVPLFTLCEPILQYVSLQFYFLLSLPSVKINFTVAERARYEYIANSNPQEITHFHKSVKIHTCKNIYSHSPSHYLSFITENLFTMSSMGPVVMWA